MNKRLLILMFFSLLLSLSSKGYAGIEPYEKFIKGKIKTGDTVVVRDEKFRNPQYNWNDISNISVRNQITFRILDEKSLTKSFSAVVDLNIQYYSSPEQTTPAEIQSVKLRVNYKAGAGAIYKVSDSYEFSNGYYIKVKVTSIKSPEFGNNLPEVFQLTNRVIIDRQYKFKPEYSFNLNPVPAETLTRNLITAAAFTGNAQEALTGNTLNLAWDPITGGEEYDLEWTTVEAGSAYERIVSKMTSGENVDTDSLNYLFRNNATRITTPGNEYSISLVFNANYLAVRIREVQYNAERIRLEGNWDYDFENGQYAVWKLNWHEQNKNWQYSATYAEEGKKKEVISYFDGTLRSRQTATINNSDNVAVVQENIYDEFGRQAAAILPAPVKEGIQPSLHYFSSFNQNSQSRPYNFQDLRASLAGCEFLPAMMSTESGASKYYSPQNQFLKDEKYNPYIPNAEGYPFSVTEYTADNSGRIKFQGGVGSKFQPGMDSAKKPGGATNSKTTKYYYGKPEQWELNRLFGNDAGYAEHYLKNMVMDPNGQTSISYLNASGKTIATALTGEAPASQDALNSAAAAKTQNITLLKPEQFIFSNSSLQLVASTTHLASMAGVGTFSYSIEKLISKYPGGAFEPCSNCHYELTIRISNDCNEVVYTTTEPVKIGSETANEFGTGTYTSAFSMTFDKPGEYYINFALAFNKDVIDNYATEFIAGGQSSGFLKKEFDFIEEQLKKTEFSGNFSDCQTCEAQLGTKEAFQNMFRGKLISSDVDQLSLDDASFISWLSGAYDSLKVNCTLLQSDCYAVSPCDEYEKIMFEDVSPGGQYALFMANGAVLEPELNVLALNWRTEFPVAAVNSTVYRSENITLEDGTTTSPHASGFTLEKLVRYWKEDWAAKFLKYHPEYCKLQFCQESSSYLNWDNQVKEQISKSANIALIPGADNLQYDPGNASWLLAADPFFKAGAPGFAYLSQMQEDLEQYTSKVLGYPSASVKGVTQFVDYMLYCADISSSTNSSLNGNPWNNCVFKADCRVPDKEWQQYRGIYLEVKEKYYRYVRDNSTCAGQTCIIGSPYVLNSAGSINIKDFVVSGTREGLDLCEGKQMLAVTYLPGPVSKAVTVEVYYPGQEAIVSLQFAAGENKKVICVPVGIPVNTVKVSAVIQ